MPAELREAFQEDGVAVGPNLFPKNLLRAANASADEMLAAGATTATMPAPVHVSSAAIGALLAHRPLGEFVARAAA